MEHTKPSHETGTTLVLGGNGKTGRRIVQALDTLGVQVRIGSRNSQPAFDWQLADTWEAALKDVDKVYISFYPDLAMPGSVDIIRAFTDKAVASGVKHFVLLAGRGEEEAQLCEQVVQYAGVDWTILRVSWFCQNFSEGYLWDAIMSGVVALPAGEVKEPFIDIDDIAEVAVKALTEEGHTGKVYEMTGPELLTFKDAVEKIASASGREIQYLQIPVEDFLAGAKQQGLPRDMVSLLEYLFTTVLDGHNSFITAGVEQALGRKAKDFASFARDAAGAWE